MAAVSINLPDTLSQVEQMAVKRHLEKLAQNITKDNLSFLAEISEKPNVNNKLENKKSLIKSFL